MAFFFTFFLQPQSLKIQTTDFLLWLSLGKETVSVFLLQKKSSKQLKLILLFNTIVTTFNLT